jgi:hypothetical protein
MAEQGSSLNIGSPLWRLRPHWSLTLFPAAREATGSFQPAKRAARSADGASSVRSPAEAARRAQGKIRRYCAANGLNRLGTLTYAGEGCHDPVQLRADVAEFFVRLRRTGFEGRKIYLPLAHGASEQRGIAYLWVPQWHPGGHGLHVHFAVGRYIDRSAIERAWGHGFVHIKLLSGLATGSGWLQEARLAARYLSRYVAEQLDDERRPPGLHRYEVGQGFQPEEVKLRGRSPDALIKRASELLGREPRRVWRSEQAESWHGPPACWVQWD